MFQLCRTFAHPKSRPVHHMFHRTLLDVLDSLPSFCSTPPPTQTSLPMTGIRMSSQVLRAEACCLAAWSNRALIATIARPHVIRSATHGIAESAVRSVSEGTSTILLQSGLDEQWWADFYGMLLLLTQYPRFLSRWEKSPYERRFEQPFSGPIAPSGAKVGYHPTSTKNQVRLQQFGK